MINTNKASVANVIAYNSTLLTPGTTLSANVLDTMFHIDMPALTENMSPNAIFKAINTRNLQRVTAYTKLNKALADRGVAIHQSTVNESTSYFIREVAQLPKDITSYRRKGKRALKRSAKLATAFQQLAIPGIER